MKKLFIQWPLLLAALLVLGACSDENDDVNISKRVTYTDGVLVLNEGAYYYGVDGSLDVYSYSGQAMNRGVFASVNGRSLGNTPNDMVQCGDRIFISTTSENRIEVVDAETFASEAVISVTSPRGLAADDAYVYASTYTGNVVKIDASTAEIVAVSAVVGDCLEEVAVAGDYLYVCNSYTMDASYNYTYHDNVVKMRTSDLSKVKDITVTLNPTEITTDGTNVYVLSMGNYSDTSSDVQKIDASDKVTSLAVATMMAYSPQDGLLYLINAPWGGQTTYFTCNPSTGVTETMTGVSVTYPFAISVDPVKGYVWISSLTINEDTGYADYTADGYLACFRNYSGTFKETTHVTTGPCPGKIGFQTHEEIF